MNEIEQYLSFVSKLSVQKELLLNKPDEPDKLFTEIKKIVQSGFFTFDETESFKSGGTAYFKTKPVLKAYLFGSYSRNEADEKSDVDILVELDYDKHIGLGFVQMQLDLQELLHKNIDLVSQNGISKHIAPYINQDKQLIYAK